MNAVLIYLMMLENEEQQEQFMEIYNRCEKAVMGTAMKYLKNKDRAEDAFQETWTKVAHHFQKIISIPSEKINGYIVVMVRNAAFDMIRGESRVIDQAEGWEDFIPAREEGQSEYDYLVSIIRAMPETNREVLELKLVLEWTTDEIARYLDLKPSTVSMRIQRGKELLKERLEKEGYTVP